jgi:hypothetical protein
MSLKHVIPEWVVNVVYPNPCRERWSVLIKQTFHCTLDARRHIPESTMVDPVLGSVPCEWDSFDTIFIDATPEREQDAEGSLCENRMRRFERNVEMR